MNKQKALRFELADLLRYRPTQNGGFFSVAGFVKLTLL